MRVLGAESTADPTAVEAEVRRQMEERQAAHDDRWGARALCCAVLCCAVLCCAALSCAVLCCAVRVAVVSSALWAMVVWRVDNEATERSTSCYTAATNANCSPPLPPPPPPTQERGAHAHAGGEAGEEDAEDV